MLGDLRCHRGHYDVTVMRCCNTWCCQSTSVSIVCSGADKKTHQSSMSQTETTLQRFHWHSYYNFSHSIYRICIIFIMGGQLDLWTSVKKFWYYFFRWRFIEYGTLSPGSHLECVSRGPTKCCQARLSGSLMSHHQSTWDADSEAEYLVVLFHKK